MSLFVENLEGSHPSSRELESYLSGVVEDDNLAQRIETHLSECEACAETALSIHPGNFEIAIKRLWDSNPETVDAYDLLEEVGRGSGGIVFRARQKSLNREVAVKMLISGSSASAPELARFRRESAALAQLDHPNILSVYDSGEMDGVPFIAMEYVDGPTLSQWCRAKPRDPRVIARIVASLAGAIQIAHEKGILHRDLKPQNVILSTSENSNNTPGPLNDHPRQGQAKDPLPKIGDFGLSKFDDGQFQTETGLTLGTPAYIAPEIVAGGAATATAATDVYGLGTILYECLTGRPPFSGELAVDILKSVSQQDPNPLVSFRAGLPRDLQTICDRCLQKSPARRFANANELKQELTRFLSHQPIVSRPISRSERILKWTKRNPWPTSIAILAVASIIVAATGIWLHQNRIEAERSLANRNYQSTRATVERMLTELDSRSLPEITDDRDLAWTQTEQALALFEKLAMTDNSAESQFDLAHLRLRAGSIKVARGEFDSGYEYFQTAAEQLIRLRQSDDDVKILSYVVASQVKLGYALTMKNRFEDSEQLLKSAMPLANEVLRLDNSIQNRDQLAWLHHNLGTTYFGLGQPEDAIVQFDSAIGIRKSLLESAGENRELLRRLSESYVSRASCLNSLGRNEEAEQTFGESIRTLTELSRLEPGNSSIAVALAVGYLNLGNTFANDGRPEDAVQSCTNGIELLTPFVEGDVHHYEAKRHYTMLLGNRALYNSELDPHQSALDWKSAAENAEDKPVRDYCVTMKWRFWIDEHHSEDVFREIEQEDILAFSNANRFRYAAVLGLLLNATDNSATSERQSGLPETVSTSQNSDYREELGQRLKTVLLELRKDGFFAADQESLAYLNSSDDFSSFRKSTSSEVLNRVGIQVAGE